MQRWLGCERQSQHRRTVTSHTGAFDGGKAMRIVSESDLEWSQSRTGVQRGGQNESKSLLNGEPGALDNFDFWISRAVGSGNTSPRHRHNFDQFRFALRGEHDSGPDV